MFWIASASQFNWRWTKTCNEHSLSNEHIVGLPKNLCCFLTEGISIAAVNQTRIEAIFIEKKETLQPFLMHRGLLCQPKGDLVCDFATTNPCNTKEFASYEYSCACAQNNDCTDFLMLRWRDNAKSTFPSRYVVIRRAFRISPRIGFEMPASAIRCGRSAPAHCFFYASVDAGKYDAAATIRHNILWLTTWRRGACGRRWMFSRSPRKSNSVPAFSR